MEFGLSPGQALTPSFQDFSVDIHQAEHAEFRARLEELQLKSIGEDISADTVSFLNHWLTNHIAHTDMAYVPYLKRDGI